MGRIVVSEFLSLDGVMEAPQDWHFPFISPDMMAAVAAHIHESEALLLGRTTYEEFAAAWPLQRNNEHGIADKLNAMPKHVVSSTLGAVSWNNSTLIQGDVTQQVRALKQQLSGSISVQGSVRLVQTLEGAGLIDEYRLMVHPMLVGQGKRLFTEKTRTSRWELSGNVAFEGGVVLLTYQTAPQ
jgi:dihydrofolate reductase